MNGKNIWTEHQWSFGTILRRLMWNLSSRKGEGCIWQIRYRGDLFTHKTRRWTFRLATFKCSKDVRNMPISSLISAFSWILASFCKKAFSMRQGLSFNSAIFITFWFSHPRRKGLLFLHVYKPAIQGRTLIGPRWAKCPLGPILIVRGWRILTDTSWIRCLTVQD